MKLCRIGRIPIRPSIHHRDLGESQRVLHESSVGLPEGYLFLPKGFESQPKGLRVSCKDPQAWWRGHSEGSEDETGGSLGQTEEVDEVFEVLAGCDCECGNFA